MLFAGNMLKHPCFDQLRESGQGYRVVGDLANTDLIMENTFWIGVSPKMNDARLNAMSQAIHQYFEEAGSR